MDEGWSRLTSSACLPPSYRTRRTLTFSRWVVSNRIGVRTLLGSRVGSRGLGLAWETRGRKEAEEKARAARSRAAVE